MTINEKLKQLDGDILAIIRRFEEATACTVWSIETTRTCLDTGGCRTYEVRAFVAVDPYRTPTGDQESQ